MPCRILLLLLLLFGRPSLRTFDTMPVAAGTEGQRQSWWNEVGKDRRNASGLPPVDVSLNAQSDNKCEAAVWLCTGAK